MEERGREDEGSISQVRLWLAGTPPGGLPPCLAPSTVGAHRLAGISQEPGLGLRRLLHLVESARVALPPFEYKLGILLVEDALGD